MSDLGVPASAFGVALGNPGEATTNTLVLATFDLVLPLERDLDGDPLQDDEVHLVSDDGSLDRRLTADDPDVRDGDDGLLWYTFRDVPFGVYHVRVVVGGERMEVMHGVEVRRRGVFYQGRALGESAPSRETGGELDDPTGPPVVEEEDSRDRFEFLPDAEDAPW